MNDTPLTLNNQIKNKPLNYYLENPSQIDDTSRNDHNLIIKSKFLKIEMNYQNLNDLEAIYFPDKVNLRSKSVAGEKVPKLDFKFNRDEKENSSSVVETQQDINKITKIKNLKSHYSSLNMNNNLVPEKSQSVLGFNISANVKSMYNSNFKK